MKYKEKAIINNSNREIVDIFDLEEMKMFLIYAIDKTKVKDIEKEVENYIKRMNSGEKIKFEYKGITEELSLATEEDIREYQKQQNESD